MSPPCCSHCEDVFTSKSPGLSCSGPCKKSFHLACVKLPLHLSSLLKENTGLLWKCTECLNYPVILNRVEIVKLLNEKTQEIINSLNNSFDTFKTTFVESTIEKLTDSIKRNISTTITTTADKSYASILAADSKTSVSIKPKNQSQSKAITKSDILKKINPVASDIQIKSVKSINNGGIVLNLREQKDADKFTTIAQQNMSENYEVRVLKNMMPRIKIVGLSQDLDDFTLCRFLLKQNPDVFTEESTCKLLKHGPTKKYPDRFQAIFQVDAITYKKVLDAGRVMVGLESCAVYKAIDVLRCFRCNGYHHSSRNCKNAIKCPLCAAEHAVNDCKSHQDLRCCNCTSFNNKNKVNVDTHHAAWDHKNCHVYTQLIAELKRDILPATQ